MANFNLYVDCAGGGLVNGIADMTPAPMPALFQGDTLSLQIYPLARASSYPLGAPFTLVGTAGLSLQVAIGTKIGNAATYYTQQFTWQTDANNTYFYANLPLNTAAITTLLGTSATASAWFAIALISSGTPTTILEIPVTINAATIQGGALVIPPGQTPVSAEYCKATFLTRNISGAIIFSSPAGKKVALYASDDGTIHMDQIT